MLSPVNWPSESRSPYRQHRDTGHRLQLAWRLPWHQYWECLWQLFINTYLGNKVDAFTLESVTVTELSFDLHISMEEGENVGCPVRHCRNEDTFCRVEARNNLTETVRTGNWQRRRPSWPGHGLWKNSIWYWMTGRGRRLRPLQIQPVHQSGSNLQHA